MNKILLFITLSFCSQLPASQASLTYKDKTLLKPVESYKAELSSTAVQKESSITFHRVQRLQTYQHVVYYGETHNHNDTRQQGNQRNFKILQRLMEFADQFNVDSQAFQIFVEQFVPVNKQDVILGGKVPKTIPQGLVLLAKKMKYKRSKVVDCEVRNVYCVAKIIMELEPGEYQVYEKMIFMHDALEELYGCKFLEITWADVVKDFDRLCRTSEEYITGWANPRIKAQFTRMLDIAKRTFAPVRDYIESRESNPSSDDPTGLLLLDPEESIFTYYKKNGQQIYAKRSLKDKMENFLDRLTTSFSPFVDIYLFHEILTLRQKPIPIIILYTGKNHSQRVAVALDLSEVAIYNPPSVYEEQFSVKDFIPLFNFLPHLHEVTPIKKEIPREEQFTRAAPLREELAADVHTFKQLPLEEEEYLPGNATESWYSFKQLQRIMAKNNKSSYNYLVIALVASAALSIQLYKVIITKTTHPIPETDNSTNDSVEVIY